MDRRHDIEKSLSESWPQSDWGSAILQVNISSQIIVKSQTDTTTDMTA